VSLSSSCKLELHFGAQEGQEVTAESTGEISSSPVVVFQFFTSHSDQTTGNVKKRRNNFLRWPSFLLACSYHVCDGKDFPPMPTQ